MAKLCAICGVASERHAPCAICWRTNQTVKLCPFCRAQNELYGIEWNERDLATGESDDIGGDERRVTTTTMGELAGRRRQRPAPKRARAARLLRDRQMRELVHYVDRRGRWRGYYERTVFLSRREIARRAGCSHTYVNRIFRESIARRSSRR